MAGFTDALRGYAFPIHQREAFRCRYCGLDGTESSATWLSLLWAHLLPKGDPRRDDPDYIVTACIFCHVADNRYFDLAAQRGLSFEVLTPDELVVQRLPYVGAGSAGPDGPPREVGSEHDAPTRDDDNLDGPFRERMSEICK